MRKLIATILCLAMVLVLGVPAVMAAGTADANDIVILYTNDVHTSEVRCHCCFEN